MNVHGHYEALMALAAETRAVNTHAHHLPDGDFEGFDLKRLLENAYVSWYGEPVGEDDEAHAKYLSRVGNTTYFIWLERALRALYRIDEPLTARSWARYDEAVKRAHAAGWRGAPAHLRMADWYERVIQDAYWAPGSDNGHPALFAPVFRVNMFFYGYDRAARDHNGNNARAHYGVDIEDLDAYVAFVKDKITEMKQRGCVALKSALAYDRDLDFGPPDRERARRAFQRRASGPEAADVRAFQDYLFDAVCKIAAELSLPFQNHTGLGQLTGTRAINLRGAIERNPDTRFVLFHGGYPWSDDILGLAHNYRNVYPDLCWLPLISTHRAERFVNELLDVTPPDLIAWGCDTWSAEESYGALLAGRHALCAALDARVREGYMDAPEAERVLTAVLAGNARKLYGLPSPSRA